jgi:hypothetical protein
MDRPQYSLIALFTFITSVAIGFAYVKWFGIAGLLSVLPPLIELSSICIFLWIIWPRASLTTFVARYYLGRHSRP